MSTSDDLGSNMAKEIHVPVALLAPRSGPAQTVHERPVILVSVSITSAAIAAAALRMAH
jgi:hypothetical protein